MVEKQLRNKRRKQASLFNRGSKSLSELNQEISLECGQSPTLQIRLGGKEFARKKLLPDHMKSCLKANYIDETEGTLR